MRPRPVIDTRQQILDTARGIIVGKGFSAVGLSEILAAAGVPKGSFYHWFGSKEQFGEALLDRHFEGYLRQVDTCLTAPRRTAGQRLLDFFGQWHALQSGHDVQARCLVVKLSAEVCDLSEPMRAALERGTAQVLARLATCLADGIATGELARCPDPADVAQQLYQQWLGATLLARVQRSDEPLDRALAHTTRWVREQTTDGTDLPAASAPS
ncbi:MAG: TetR/AcrR family transcriptional regulator [Pseudomonadota bacterium]|nr:TetR/AcrR family transcriptional regulator [Pseudomonadota bacterium]